MADYKEMISDTFGKLAEEVKNHTSGKSFRDIFSDGANRAGNIGKTAKMIYEINSESNELKKVYAEIGKLFYEEHQGHGESFYAPLFERIEELNLSIDEKRAELERIKEAAGKAFTSDEVQSAERDIEVDIIDFDEIVDESGKN